MLFGGTMLSPSILYLRQEILLEVILSVLPFAGPDDFTKLQDFERELRQASNTQFA